MTTVADILNFVETLAPRELKMDWDNVGLNCGRRNAPVRKILVALDPFEHVCREAVQWDADLLVTHHPLIFRPLPMVTDDAAITRGLMELVRHDISHICAVLHSQISDYVQFMSISIHTMFQNRDDLSIGITLLNRMQQRLIDQRKLICRIISPITDNDQIISARALNIALHVRFASVISKKTCCSSGRIIIHRHMTSICLLEPLLN